MTYLRYVCPLKMSTIKVGWTAIQIVNRLSQTHIYIHGDRVFLPGHYSSIAVQFAYAWEFIAVRKGLGF